MERSTAKTMDCFIEFLSVHDARAMIKKFDRMQEDGRPAKIGLRAVEYELSTQRELQKSLFPRAKCVDWTGGSPKILPCTDPWSTGFQGFVTREEMHQLVRHAEVPARVSPPDVCPRFAMLEAPILPNSVKVDLSEHIMHSKQIFKGRSP
jgi:hypothetical protein